MLHTMKRGLVLGTVVAIAAALCSASAMAARGHGKLGPRASTFGLQGGFGAFAGMPGFGGAMVWSKGVGGHGLRGHGFGFGARGHGAGGGGLLTGELLKTTASYLGISLATLQADLKAGKTLAEEAVAKGKTADGLIKALSDAAKENLDAAVAAGWLTESQATRIHEAVTAAITALVKSGPPVPPGMKTGPFQAAATYLGMTTTALLEALRDGKTLGQVAADRGKSVEGLVGALTADAKKRLDAAVEEQKLTRPQADAILKRLTESATNWVNGVKGPKAASATTTNAIKHALRFAVRR
jgi:hypothetical protein